MLELLCCHNLNSFNVGCCIVAGYLNSWRLGVQNRSCQCLRRWNMWSNPDNLVTLPVPACKTCTFYNMLFQGHLSDHMSLCLRIVSFCGYSLPILLSPRYNDLILTLPYTINTPLDYWGPLHSQAVFSSLAHKNSVGIVLVATAI